MKLFWKEEHMFIFYSTIKKTNIYVLLQGVEFKTWHYVVTTMIYK
jgi:hypothetical protein